LVSCDPNEPEITFCVLIPNEFSSYCFDTKTGNEYELPIAKLNGWISASPEDFSEMKKYYKEVKAELKECRDR